MSLAFPPPSRSIKVALRLLIFCHLSLLVASAVEPIRYLATGARIGVYTQSTDETRSYYFAPSSLAGYGCGFANARLML